MLKERAGTVEADAAGLGTEVTWSRHAVTAPPADHMTISGDNLPGTEVIDVVSHLDDLAHELVAHHHRHGDGFLGPGVPVVYVKIGSADPGLIYANENVADSDVRDGRIDQFQTGSIFCFG